MISMAVYEIESLKYVETTEEPVLNNRDSRASPNLLRIIISLAVSLSRKAFPPRAAAREAEQG